MRDFYLRECQNTYKDQLSSGWYLKDQLLDSLMIIFGILGTGQEL